MRTAEWSDAISVLDRVTAVLEALGAQDEGLGVSEIARRANLPKSTVSRLAADLVRQGYLDRIGDRLYLGMRLFELGQAVPQTRRLRELALPILAELRAELRAPVQLGILDGRDVVIVAALRGPVPSEALDTVGSRSGALASAIGRSLRERGDTDRLPAQIGPSAVTVDDRPGPDGRIRIAAPVVVPFDRPTAAIGARIALDDLAEAGSALRAAAAGLTRRLASSASR